MAALTASMLGQLGFEAAVATDGNQALAALARETFQLVLLEISLPGMSGPAFLEVASRTKALGDVPVLASTAVYGADSPAVKLMRERGARRVLRKPIALPDLRRAVEAVVLPPKRLKVPPTNPGKAATGSGTNPGGRVRTTRPGVPAVRLTRPGARIADPSLDQTLSDTPVPPPPQRTTAPARHAPISKPPALDADTSTGGYRLPGKRVTQSGVRVPTSAGSRVPARPEGPAASDRIRAIAHFGRKRSDCLIESKIGEDLILRFEIDPPGRGDSLRLHVATWGRFDNHPSSVEVKLLGRVDKLRRDGLATLVRVSIQAATPPAAHERLLRNVPGRR